MRYFVAGKEQDALMRKKTSSVAGETDSGIEDTAGYREPTWISLRESEFHTNGDDGDASEMEGSVVDTDYVDRFTTKTANGDVDVSQGREVQRRVDNVDDEQTRDTTRDTTHSNIAA